MASVEELQDELVRQSSRRLEAEHERTRLDEELRRLLRENSTLRQENAVQTQRAEEMESEMADLSSSLVEQANVQVAEANRKVATAQRMVSERDTLLEIQASQLQEIKLMMAQQEEAVSQRKLPKRARRPSFKKALDADAILDLDSYASPVRPLLRFDTREFRDFCEIFPVEGTQRSFHFSLEALEAPAWRRSRFVQKLIQEDIEPALRLDRAAHMNWLTCRAFLTAVLEQTLILEPVSSKERPWAHRPSHPCLLCGENRSELIYSRYFWARTSAEAEPLVLDLACLARVRLACELVGFIRTITDAKPGHTREQQEQAWHECASLREQLFWARSGGLYPEGGAAAGGDDDAQNAAHHPAHELEVMPRSAAATPALSQSGFGSAVASPANTLSNAALSSAVGAGAGPGPGADQPSAVDSTAGSAHADHSSTGHSSAGQTSARAPDHKLPNQRFVGAASAASPASPASEASARGAAAADPVDSPLAKNTLGSERAQRSEHTSEHTQEHTSGSNYTTMEPPGADAPAKPSAIATAAGAEANRDEPRDAEATIRDAADDQGASPTQGSSNAEKADAEFRFDDDEFHSLAGTPEPAPAASASPSPEPTPREAMPGGWPG